MRFDPVIKALFEKCGKQEKNKAEVVKINYGRIGDIYHSIRLSTLNMVIKLCAVGEDLLLR